jgi:hypothetical protein
MYRKFMGLIVSAGLFAVASQATASDSLAGNIFPLSQTFCLTKSATLHASGSRGSRVLAQLSAGSQYHATGKTGNNRWIRLNAKGKTGFVKRRSVKTC